MGFHSQFFYVRTLWYNDLRGKFVKRVVISLCALFLMLTGCSSKSDTLSTDHTVNQSQMEIYETYYDAVMSEDSFMEDSENYTISTEMNKVPDGTYRYYVIFDEPKTAMFNCIILAVENDTSYKDAGKMMPSAGIFDTPSNMIPNQVNYDDGYVKGIALSGETDQNTVDLKILVQWTNQDGSHTQREFIHRALTADDAQ